MNRQGPLSPVSISSNEWSGADRYKDSGSRNNLITPPVSGYSNGMSTMSGMSGMNGRSGDFRGNPSPPSSIGRQSIQSNGTNTSGDTQRRKQVMMEESLGQHYSVLKRYLANTIREDAAEGKPNRARDKLVRLSPIQFQELSTDVYDELLRRQTSQNGGGPLSPEFLPPIDNFHPKRNQARQKLSTLPAPRFRALATDVFFELERRIPRFAGGDIGRGTSPATSMRGPPSRTGTPSGMRPGSRDQGRRPPPRQGSLGGQVLAGLGIPGPDGFNGPTQKSSQSNTIVPNKSYLVEDDDDGDTDSFMYGLNRRDTANTTRSFGANEKIITDYQNKVEELQSKIGDIEKKVLEKDDAIKRLESSHRDRERANSNASSEWTTLRLDLENKLADAQSLNANLQNEIEKMKSYHDDAERDFKDQLNVMVKKSTDGGEWKQRHDDLQREMQYTQLDNDELRRELEDQQRVTEEVRREASVFLEEMKAISDRSDETWQQEQKMVAQVRKLEEELQEWKSRYARSQAQLRTAARTASMSLSIPQPDMGKDGGLLQPNGLIKDIHISRFQLAIDETLRVARMDPSGVQEHMKSVVNSVRHITEDIPETASPDDTRGQQLSKFRAKVSATANNFITASKNYSQSKGLSPVSLLDAAASHLSTAVVELIQIAKMRPTPPGEMDDDDIVVPTNNAAKYLSMNGRSSATESVYSTMTAAYGRTSQTPQTININGRAPSANGVSNGTSNKVPNYGIEERDEQMEDLRNILETQTTSLIQAIQQLVTSIRSSSASPANISKQTTEIANTITSILNDTDASLGEEITPALRSALGPSMSHLANCKTRLLQADDECRTCTDEEEWREVVQSIPPVAFEVAREARELVGRVGDVIGAGGDDFR